MRAHEPDTAGKFCRHCHVRWAADLTQASCIWRPDSGPAPEPKARVLACEDQDAISARLAELRAEREKTIAGEAEPEPPLPLSDECCLG